MYLQKRKLETKATIITKKKKTNKKEETTLRPLHAGV
jgi:hypothetical protein